ncbi:hypothetical protein CapIbe_023479 [Capra ibex]
MARGEVTPNLIRNHATDSWAARNVVTGQEQQVTSKTYLPLILRHHAQWVYQQTRMKHHCPGCPCEMVGKSWLNCGEYL